MEGWRFRDGQHEATADSDGEGSRPDPGEPSAVLGRRLHHPFRAWFSRCRPDLQLNPPNPPAAFATHTSHARAPKVSCAGSRPSFAKFAESHGRGRDLQLKFVPRDVTSALRTFWSRGRCDQNLDTRVRD